MNDYSPSSLPAVSAVEIVVLHGIPSNRVDQYMSDVANERSVVIEDAAAEQIATLWRQLPPGEQARCHVPPFGLRFFSSGQLLCEASICWLCNNIFGAANGGQFSYEFDAEAGQSQQLLKELERLSGVKAES